MNTDNKIILKDLLEDLKGCHITGSVDIPVSGIVYDSRNVEQESLFVALKGFNSDGHEYIGKALEAGASAILVSEPVDAPEGVTVINVEDTRKALALVSAAYFGHPERELCIIGITGTKGKTTTSHMVKAILEASGKKTGMIGTLGAFIGDKLIKTKNTTPDSHELQSLFRQMAEEGCTHVVMEVSSQGVKLDRTYGLEFDIAAFLNLSPDHISPGEHESFEEYRHFKELVFCQAKKAVMNLDGDYAAEFVDFASGHMNAEDIYTVSITGDASLTGGGIRNINEAGVLGSKLELSGSLSGEVTVPMPGTFNVENAMTACCIAALLNISLQDVGKGLLNVTVRGRTQLIREVTERTGAVFIIDYAHNALSTEALLTLLRGYSPKRLICLFGGGGNRPKNRRYDMGEISAKYADLTILTEDNPRFEDIEDINRDILEGVNVHNGEYLIINDRKEAIEYLLENTGSGDICALIGKGHETYQDVRGEKHYFCEEEVIRNWLNASDKQAPL